jgi:hypothetical protein
VIWELTSATGLGQKIMIITIDTHHCTEEEKQELIKYLEENCWDWKKLQASSSKLQA